MRRVGGEELRHVITVRRVLGLVALSLAATGSTRAQPAAAIDTAQTLRPGLEIHGMAATDRADLERAIAARDWDAATKLLARESERAPSAELLVALGRVFMAAGRPLNAAVAFKKAETLAPLDDATRFSLALAYVAIGRREWARPELERLAASAPSDMTYVYWLGRLDYDDGRYASAIARFEQVVAADPTSVRAYDNLGLAYDAQHQPERAIASHERAVQLNRGAAKRSPWPPLNLAVLRRQRGELSPAEALLREAIAIDGTVGQAHHELGLVLEQAGAADQAVRAFQAAVVAAPAFAEPHYALARVLRRMGRSADAEAEMATFRRLQGAKAGEP
jgi:tetratricopeptide (TPR) repeat protein